MVLDDKTVNKVNERKRVYYFPDGSAVVLFDVMEVIVSDTTHRIKTRHRHVPGAFILHIIPNGWNHIEVQAEEWTF